MHRARRKIATTLTALAGLIAALVAATFPAIYFFASYSGMSGTLQARAEGFAMAVNRLVSGAPDVWQYQHDRLEVQLQRLMDSSSTEHARIFNQNGNSIVQAGLAIEPPVMVRSAPLYDSGTAVGRIEVVETLRPLLLGTGVVGLAGLLLAAGVFCTLRSLPLRALDRALNEAEAGRVLLMEAERIARMGSWDYQVAGGTLAWSDHLFHVLGFRPPLLPSLRAVCARVQRQDRRRLCAAMRSWRTGTPQPVLEIRVCLPQGDVHTLLVECEVLRESDGAVKRVRGTVLDITEQKRVQEEIRRLNEALEERVKERTHELEHTVSELETFSHSVAHDLRAPIRSINNYSHLLLNAPGTRLDPEGRRYLERVIGASGRMAALIDGLLALARVSRSKLRPQTIDLTALARSVMDELADSDKGRQVRFEVEPGLRVTADAALMRIVLVNLLGNAWKFTAKVPQPHIEFRRDDEHGQRWLLVRDNGAGFDMRYAHKLFGTFQRLHRAEDYPGTGIGLVTVHRILARHGGAVRVSGEIGKGTTVYFTV